MYFYLILHDNFCNFFSMIVKVHACQNLDAHLENPCISQELATEKYPQLMFMVWSRPPQTWLWHVRPHQTPQRWMKETVLCMCSVDVKGLWSLNQQIWLLFSCLPHNTTILLYYCFPYRPLLCFSPSHLPPLWLILSFFFQIWKRIFLKSWWIWQMRKWRLSGWAGTTLDSLPEHSSREPRSAQVSPCQPVWPEGSCKGKSNVCSEYCPMGPYESLQVMCDAPLLPSWALSSL